MITAIIIYLVGVVWAAYIISKRPFRMEEIERLKENHPEYNTAKLEKYTRLSMIAAFSSLSWIIVIVNFTENHLRN